MLKSSAVQTEWGGLQIKPWSSFYGTLCGCKMVGDKRAMLATHERRKQMQRTKLLLVVSVVVALAMVLPGSASAAQGGPANAVKNAAKGFWGMLIRTPEAVIVDVCGGVANMFSGVTLVLSDLFSVADRVPAGGYVFDGVFSNGFEEFACFMHAGGANAIEIGTRRDFSDIPIEREAFLQREGVFHREAYKTFLYGARSFSLAVLDLVTGIPANACTIVGLTDTADSITKAADTAAEGMFGTIQWKYKED